MMDFLAFCLFFLGAVQCIVGFTAIDRKIRIFFLLVGILSIAIALYCYQNGFRSETRPLPARIIFEY